jgi:phage baseplate assembly protein W
MGMDISYTLDPGISGTIAAGVDVPKELGDIYGVDIYFDGQKRVSAAGDWQSVQAEENLRRGILRRILTAPGTYRWKPNYGVGMGTFLKKPVNAAVVEQLTSRIISQVGQDRRVDKVVSVTVTPVLFGDQPGLRVVVVVQALGRKQLPIGMTFKRTA